MKSYKIVAIPGDGIGGEVVSVGVEVLNALAQKDGTFEFQVDRFDWGREHYKKYGTMTPENGRDRIRNHDAILFGRAGHPEIARPYHHPIGFALRDLPALRPICQRSTDPHSAGYQITSSER